MAILTFIGETGLFGITGRAQALVRMKVILHCRVEYNLKDFGK